MQRKQRPSSKKSYLYKIVVCVICFSVAFLLTSDWEYKKQDILDADPRVRAALSKCSDARTNPAVRCAIS